MEAKRARRIRDKQRMKAKAQSVGKARGLPGNYDLLYDHLCICSGPCCGNPRRWYGEPTMQERRFLAG